MSREGMVVIDEEETNESYGNAPLCRPMEKHLQLSFIPLDKPAGPTSHEVVAWVRKILGVEKAGHSGTLDPPATGLLPVGLGDATKALTVLLMGPKEYYTVARLHDPADDKTLMDTLSLFTGEIYQRPPQRSSVKRVTRTRMIYELELVERVGNLLLLRVLCQAGTYIRKLVYDMGEILGPGATMVELRRSRVSHLSEDDGLVKLHELLDAYQSWKESGDEDGLRKLVKPVEDVVSHLKTVTIRDSAVDAICHGAQLAVPGVLKVSKGIGKGDPVTVLTLKDELVALAEATMSTEELAESKKGLAMLTKRVIMRPGTYPRMWKAGEKGKAGVA